MSASRCSPAHSRRITWAPPPAPRLLPPSREVSRSFTPQPAVEVGPGPALSIPPAGLTCAPLPWPAELDLQRSLSLQAPPVKEGPLFIHRTKGKGPLMSSFKKLHFSLTTEALSFAKTPSSKVGKEGGGQGGPREVPGGPSQFLGAHPRVRRG